MKNLFYSKYIISLITICELLILSYHMFSQGFLLKREVLQNKSLCKSFQQQPDSCNALAGFSKGCWSHRTFNKVIIIVIDALRLDFVTYDENLASSDKKPFKNKIKSIHDLLKNSPKKGLLLPFIADPPTTTMQRLKGLTTGSLPTFIDASHNFASAEITEDNIIDQMKSQDMNIVALGDDTWGHLYPKRFHRSFLYPSFNVMDLDTVDNGILDNIYSEIPKDDWRVIIAHFLGVDHCGHRYGPNHQMMGTKLKQMDQVIRNVSSLISEDTLLVVMGDHGMTSSGDHGGDSKNELESALFLYSPGFDLSKSSRFAPASQIDLVPTLSFLMGVPTPYSSLGRIIEDVFSSSKSGCSVSDLLYINVQQIAQYLDTYQSQNGEFPGSKFAELETLFNRFTSKGIKNITNADLSQYLLKAKSMCEDMWAKFNIWNMILGLLSVTSCVVMMLNFFVSPSNLNIRYILYLFLTINTIYGLGFFISLNILNILVALVFVSYILFVKVSFNLDQLQEVGVGALATLLVFSCGTFSNSFVVMEDSVSAFFVASLVGFLVLKHVMYKRLRKNSIVEKLPVVLVGAALLFFLRLGRLFWKCREEQYWCDPTSLIHVPLSGLPREYHNARYLSSLLPLVGLIVSPYRWLQSCGNINGFDLSVFVAKTTPVLCGLLSGGYWALQSLPAQAKNISDIAIYFPQALFALVGVSVIVVIVNPLFVYVLPSSRDPFRAGATRGSVIPHIFMQLKQQYAERSSRTPPVVYGLATAVSAPLIVLLQLIILSLIVIGGDEMAPAFCLLVVSAVFFLTLHSILTVKTASSNIDYFKPNCCSICMWFLLSVHGFYLTGHQPTFPTLNWSAAFVGYSGNGNHIIPAILIIANTFSSHIIFALALPLLVILPMSMGFLFPSLRQNKNAEVARGEFLLIENPEKTRESITSYAFLYVFFHAVKVLLTSMAAFVLRRHLMVWKIFAPHFIFEAVGLIVTCLSVCTGLIVTFRILFVLQKWSLKLN